MNYLDGKEPIFGGLEVDMDPLISNFQGTRKLNIILKLATVAE